MSIFGLGSFDIVNDDDLNCRLSRVEPKSKLLCDRRDERWTTAVFQRRRWSRRGNRKIRTRRPFQHKVKRFCDARQIFDRATGLLGQYFGQHVCRNFSTHKTATLSHAERVLPDASPISTKWTLLPLLSVTKV